MSTSMSHSVHIVPLLHLRTKMLGSLRRQGDVYIQILNSLRKKVLLTWINFINKPDTWQGIARNIDLCFLE